MQIDAMEPLELSAERVEKHTNAIGALHRLAAGLAYLDTAVLEVEAVVRERFCERHGSNVRCVVFGNDPILVESRQDLVECYFHWYAVSLVNYVRAIAAMAFESDKPARIAYQDKVLGNVAPFRDKIAAHFAGMTANQNDNDAERLVSLIPGVSWSDDRFVAAGFSTYVRKGDVRSESKAIGPWKLTEMHDDLCRRYPMLTEFTRSK